MPILKRLTIIWMLTAVAVPVAWAEVCRSKRPVCFGVDWETATVADVAQVNVAAREDDDGRTPLHWAAARTNDAAVIEALLAAGAELGARDTFRNRTPLHIAAAINPNPTIINALVNAGANVNARTRDTETPLHAAANFNDNPAVIQALIDAGANPNETTEYGLTPLHLAAIGKLNGAIIKTLLENGAAPGQKDNTGKTAFDYVADNRHLKKKDGYRILRDATHNPR